MPTMKKSASYLATLAIGAGLGAVTPSLRSEKTEQILSLGVDKQPLDCVKACAVAAWPVMAKEEISAVSVVTQPSQNQDYTLTVGMMRDKPKIKK